MNLKENCLTRQVPKIFTYKKLNVKEREAICQEHFYAFFFKLTITLASLTFVPLSHVFATGNTYTVTTLNDVVAVPWVLGTGTLREAILRANADGAVGGTVQAGFNTNNFATGLSGDINLLNELPLVFSNVVIDASRGRNNIKWHSSSC